MENASKALLMAGSVLLGIIVISLFMIMANSLTDYQQSQTQSQREAQIISFNNQFEGYVRNDVSGSDIISLINKVVYYNRTKSIEGTGQYDEGEEFGYKPIELYIDFDGKQNLLTKTTDGNNKLFTSNMEFKATKNLQNTITAIDEIEKIKNGTLPESPNGKKYNYSEGILQALSENYANGNIFVDDNVFANYSYQKKLKLFADFNTSVGKYYFNLVQDKGINKGEDQKETNLNTWFEKFFSPTSASIKSSTGRTIREDLDYYYEYTQFKRGIFEWDTKADEKIYDPNTGRIVYMKFKFTGNFI